MTETNEAAAEKKQEPKPGRDLDRLVAERLGYQWKVFTGGLGHEVGRWVNPENGFNAYPARWSHETGLDQPQYSTDIAAAWEVVEKYKLSIIPVHHGKWFCGIFDLEDEYFATDIGIIDGHFNHKSFVVADTAPLAICLAFLAIEEEK